MSLAALKDMTERFSGQLMQISQWFEHTSIVALIADRNVILSAMGAWEPLGYTDRALEGTLWADLLHPDDVHFAHAAYTPASGTVKIRIKDSDGNWHPYEWFYSGIINEVGEDTMCIGGLPVNSLDGRIYENGEVSYEPYWRME